MNYYYLKVFFILFNAFLIEYVASYACCDSKNSAAKYTDCTCLDRTGEVGTCDCKTSPNTRQGWLCIYNATTKLDSVYHLK